MGIYKGHVVSLRLKPKLGLDFSLITTSSPEVKLKNGQLISGQTDGYIKLFDDNSLELLVLKEVASAVNEVQISPAATGSGPTIEATGGDTNIDLNLTAKGTGSIASASPVAFASTLEVTGAQTNAAGIQCAAVARTATADGTGTGTIADGTSVVAVTSGNADHIIVLPTPTPGTIVWLIGDATGYELRSSAPATVAINGGTGENAESAVASTDVLTRAVCATATTWIVTHFAADGTESKADAAA